MENNSFKVKNLPQNEQEIYKNLKNKIQSLGKDTTKIFLQLLKTNNNLSNTIIEIPSDKFSNILSKTINIQIECEEEITSLLKSVLTENEIDKVLNVYNRYFVNDEEIL